MILRAIQLLTLGHGIHSASQTALWLLTAYNGVATIASIPGGRLGDRRGDLIVLMLGAASFAIAFLGFALTGPTIAALALFFGIAGLGIGFAETPKMLPSLHSLHWTFAGLPSAPSQPSNHWATSPSVLSPVCSTRPSRPALRFSTSRFGC
ncbi:MAG: hypothetical protein M3P18_14775 [Actinomycetota bacterium]|nr:hypothetical protein [Actinomycetota bacterium]